MHSLFLAKTMLSKGSVLVSADISEEMIKLYKNKFESPSSEFVTIPGNKVVVKCEELAPLGEHTWNLEANLKDLKFEDT